MYDGAVNAAIGKKQRTVRYSILNLLQNYGHGKGVDVHLWNKRPTIKTSTASLFSFFGLKGMTERYLGLSYILSILHFHLILHAFLH